MTPAVPPPPWLRLLAAPFGLRPVQLRDPAGRDEAARLLYEIFFEEQGWDPFTPNVSELRADHETRRFRDRFDERAVWLGLRDRDGTLVATMRVIPRHAPSDLELEAYFELPEDLLANTIETNRVVFARSCRGLVALTLLFNYACHVGRTLGATHTIGTTSPEVARGPARRMGWLPTGHVLRYHPEDPGPTHLLSYDLSPRYQLEVLLNVLSRRLRRSLRGTS